MDVGCALRVTEGAEGIEPRLNADGRRESERGWRFADAGGFVAGGLGFAGQPYETGGEQDAEAAGGCPGERLVGAGVLCACRQRSTETEHKSGNQ